MRQVTSKYGTPIIYLIFIKIYLFALEEEALHQFVTVLTGTWPKKQVYLSQNFTPQHGN
jgi:hypothetical protein